MICKPCREGRHGQCPDNREDSVTSTWCDCQHLPPRAEGNR